MNLPSRSAALLAFFVGLLVAAVGPLPATAQPSQADPETVVLTGGQLFDATDTTLTTNPGVVVRAGKIVAMGEADVDRSEARVVELEAEHVLMPGFIDLHAHYAVDLFGKGRVEETDGYPLLFLANGATTTFTAGELQPEKMQRLRQDVDRGNRRGPRILTSGPYFGAARPGWDTTRTPASVRAEVDRWVERGVRHFKAKRLRGLLLQALIDQAHRHGATVTGHLGSGSGSSVNPREAIDMGIDRIEHFLGGDQLPATAPAYDSLPSASPDEPAFERITRHFIEHSVFFDATISAYGYYGEQDPDVFTDWADEAQYLSPFMRDAVAGREVRDPIQRFETIYRLKLTGSRPSTTSAAVPSLPLARTIRAGGSFWPRLAFTVRCTRLPRRASPRPTCSGSPRSTEPALPA